MNLLVPFYFNFLNIQSSLLQYDLVKEVCFCDQRDGQLGYVCPVPWPKREQNFSKLGRKITRKVHLSSLDVKLGDGYKREQQKMCVMWGTKGKGLMKYET